MIVEKERGLEKPLPLREEPSAPTAPIPVSRGPSVRRAPSPAPRRDNLDRLFLARRGDLTWDQMTSFRGGSRRQGHRLMFWSMMAFVIDALVLLSLSSFFVLCFALVVRSPLGEALGGLLHLGAPKLLMIAFVLFSWIYMITLRLFFGFSVGEWACDLRLGQPTERMSALYPLRVIARTTLVVGTGLLPLPLVSILSGRDWAGILSGIRLMSLR